MVRLRFSEAASADIRAIYRQGVEGFGVGPADTYASGLRQSIGRLAFFPESAPVRESLTGPVRILTFRWHIVVYLLDEHGVHVLRVRQAREDWAGNPAGDHR